MDKKRAIIAVGCVTAVIVILVIAAVASRDKPESEEAAPAWDITGTWYGASALTEQLTIDSDTYTSSALGTGTYHWTAQGAVFTDAQGVQMQVSVSLASNEPIALTTRDYTYYREEKKAADAYMQTDAYQYAASNAEKLAIIALKTGTWSTQDDAQRLKFEDSTVTLSTKADTKTYPIEYISAFLPGQGEATQICVRMNGLDQQEGILYLQDASSGMVITSKVLPTAAGQVQSTWYQRYTDELLEVVDDSSHEGEALPSEQVLDQQRVSTNPNDPFSPYFKEPQPGDVDPDSEDKKIIKTYTRTLEGNTVTIDITYDDDTSRQEVIKRTVTFESKDIPIDWDSVDEDEESEGG